LLADADARWHAVIAEIVEHHRTGRAVLVGTRSIAASEVLSGLLHARGIEHQVLNAKQDELEAEIVAAAGLPGRVTIATSMAGRGTDIRLHPEVVGQGGLHVIATERHDNVRVDRQLAGRCARQGDPGSWQLLLSCDDEVFRNGFPRLQRWMSRWLAHWPHSRIIQTLGLWCYALAQHQLSRNHALARKRLLRADFRAREALSFTGEME
jgi:preprotein translocase subunit SecA